MPARMTSSQLLGSRYPPPPSLPFPIRVPLPYARMTSSQLLGSRCRARRLPPPAAAARWHEPLRPQDGRLFLSPLDEQPFEMGKTGTFLIRPPCAVLSIIKFREDQNDADEPETVTRHKSSRKVGSYASLLRQRTDRSLASPPCALRPAPCALRPARADARARGSDSESDDGAAQQRYDPYFLDDPEMKISKDRTVIKQEGYVVSCIPFVKPKLVKEELNGLFLAKHGDWLEGRDLTLSKIRAIKADIVEVRPPPSPPPLRPPAPPPSAELAGLRDRLCARSISSSRRRPSRMCTSKS